MSLHKNWSIEQNFIPEKFVIGKSGTKSGSVCFSCRFPVNGKMVWSGENNFKRLTGGYLPHSQKDSEVQILKEISGAVVEVPNTPISGIKISTRFNATLRNSFSWIILQDPRGFDVEITAANFKHLISDGVEFDGLELKGKFVYGFNVFTSLSNVDPVIIKVGSEKHNLSLERSKIELEKVCPSISLKRSEFKPFKVYNATAASRAGSWIYLGKMDVNGHLAQDFILDFERLPLKPELSKHWQSLNGFKYASYGYLTKQDQTIFGLNSNVHVFAKFGTDPSKVRDFKQFQFLSSTNKKFEALAEQQLSEQEVSSWKEFLYKALWNKATALGPDGCGWRPAKKEDIVKLFKAMVKEVEFMESKKNFFKSLLDQQQDTASLGLHALKLSTIYGFYNDGPSTLFTCPLCFGESKEHLHFIELFLSLNGGDGKFKLGHRRLGKTFENWMSNPSDNLEDLIQQFFDSDNSSVWIPEINVVNFKTKEILSKLDSLNSICLSRAALSHETRYAKTADEEMMS